MPTDDYIKRSDAINALTVSALLRNLDSVEDGPAHMYKRAAERIIAGVPAADVAPPIRCADCRYYERAHEKFGGWCRRPGASFFKAENFFCKCGERKEDEDAV